MRTLLAELLALIALALCGYAALWVSALGQLQARQNVSQNWWEVHGETAFSLCLLIVIFTQMTMLLRSWRERAKAIWILVVCVYFAGFVLNGILVNHEFSPLPLALLPLVLSSWLVGFKRAERPFAERASSPLMLRDTQ